MEKEHSGEEVEKEEEKEEEVHRFCYFRSQTNLAGMPTGAGIFKAFRVQWRGRASRPDRSEEAGHLDEREQDQAVVNWAQDCPQELGIVHLEKGTEGNLGGSQCALE